MKRFSSIVASALLVVSVLGVGGCAFSLPGGSGGSSSAESSAATTALNPKTTATVKAGVLTVGVNFSSAPFAGIDTAGNVVGIDVDVAAALAEELGCTVEYIDVSSEEIDTALSSGTIDIAMSLNSKDFPSAQVTTVGPYLVDGPVLFAITDSAAATSVDATSTPPSIPDNSTIAVQADSVSEYQVAILYETATLNVTEKLSEAFLSLEDSTANYVGADAVVGLYIMQDYSDISLVAPLTDTAGVYIGVDPGNTQLAADVNSALSTIESNGVLNIAISKWLGSSLSLPSPADQATYTGQ